MTPENRTDTEELAHTESVDVNPGVHQATEQDEEKVLRELFGDPDDDGFFHGHGEGEEGA